VAAEKENVVFSKKKKKNCCSHVLHIQPWHATCVEKSTQPTTSQLMDLDSSVLYPPRPHEKENAAGLPKSIETQLCTFGLLYGLAALLSDLADDGRDSKALAACF